MIYIRAYTLENLSTDTVRSLDDTGTICIWARLDSNLCATDDLTPACFARSPRHRWKSILKRLPAGLIIRTYQYMPDRKPRSTFDDHCFLLRPALERLLPEPLGLFLPFDERWHRHDVGADCMIRRGFRANTPSVCTDSHA